MEISENKLTSYAQCNLEGINIGSIIVVKKTVMVGYYNDKVGLTPWLL